MRKNLFAFAIAALMLTVAVPTGEAASVVAAEDESEWTLEFTAGLYWIDTEKECKQLHECSEYHGIALWDLDVSQWMEGDMWWNFDDNDVGNDVVTWRICEYDSSDALLGCEDWTGGQNQGALSSQTDTVRLILITNVDRVAVFDIDSV